MAGGGEVRRKRACRGGSRGRRRRGGRRSARGRDIGRSLDVDHQPGWPAQLEHAEAGGRLETDPVTDHAFEVADVGDFANLRQMWLRITENAVGEITALKHGPDAGRPLQRYQLATRVAGERCAGLPGELVLRHGTGGCEADYQPVIAVVMRKSDVRDRSGRARDAAGLVRTGECREVLGRCRDDTADRSGARSYAQGGQSKYEVGRTKGEHYGFLL